MAIAQASIGNILLRTMLPDDFALIAPQLTRIPLPVRLQLHEAGRTVERVYFPEGGTVSIVAVALDGTPREVGLFGREGMSETATVLGTDHSPHEAYVQVAGTSGLSLPTPVLNAAFEDSRTLRRHLLRYVQAMMIQLSSSIAAAGQTVEQRLARWLLMCHDRADGDEFALTHEFIAMMLGIRRAGVTEAMTALNDSGIVGRRRGVVVMRDRAALERIAASAYGLAEAEYERLIGERLRRAPGPASRPYDSAAAA